METDVVGEIVDMMYAEIKQRITEKWICFVLNITQKPFSYIRKEFFEYNSTQVHVVMILKISVGC